MKKWQEENRKSVTRRIHWLLDKQDGILLVEPCGAQFLVIIKTGYLIRLVLLSQSKPRTDLTQSYMDLRDPIALFSPYTQATMLGILWPEQISNVYVAGLGGGRVPLAIYHYFPNATIDCAEISPPIIQAAYRYFGLPNDNRLKVLIQDGRQGLAKISPSKIYDLIMVDAYLENGYTPYSMSTIEFFELCRDRLTPDGVVAANLLETDPYFLAKINTIHQVFPHVFTCNAAGDNYIIFATRSKWASKTDLAERAAELVQEHQFNFPFVEHVASIHTFADYGQQKPELNAAQVLRDAAPPADYFDLLPPMDNVFSSIDPENPCPCGSGLPFGKCHGSNYDREM